MSVTSKLASAAVLARTNFNLFERPDRLARALLSSLPWGLTTSAALASAVARTPDRAAIIDDDGPVSYRTLWQHTDGLAAQLLDNGVGDGTNVGVLCRNHRGFVEALFAVAKTGANVVLMNTGFAGPQLHDVCAAENITMLLHDDDFSDVVVSVPGCRSIDGTTSRSATTSGRTVPPNRHQGRTVILTSGTTGRPKGAARAPDAGAIEGVTALLSRVPLRPGDVQLIAAPLFHAWGLSHLMLGVTRCATSVVSRRFDPLKTLGDLGRHRARVLVAVPVMLQRMVAVGDDKLAAAHLKMSELEVIAVSGSALGGHLATTLACQFGPVVYNTYGSTEVSIAAVATPADLALHPTTVGKPATGVRVEILDKLGNAVPTGVSGRIFVGNSSRFDGYTNGETKESIHGLLSSGDVGHIDNDGYLFVDGRDDDMIISGGENLFPGEIEELLASHPAIAEVAVIGVPDPQFGQELAAFIVRRPGKRLTAAAAKKYVRANLATFKVPKTVTFVDELPRNQTGKILKRTLS